MSFFRDGAASVIYERVRDSAFYADTKAVVETMWKRYEPLNPDGGKFLRDAMQKFHASVWQMYFTCLLLDHGFRIERSSGNAPDIKVRRDDGSILWIEITTAGAGEGANSTRRPQGATVFSINEEKHVLRYQNAIRQKLEHREEFIKRGVMTESDPYVIAINAADVDDADLDDGLPNIVRSVYPVGQIAYAYNVRTDYSDPTADFDHGGEFVRPITPAVMTPKGRPAPTTGFSDGGYRGASAVVFSPHAIYNTHPPYGRECVTVYNYTASAPIPYDTFKFGVAFEPDPTALRKHDWRAPADRRDD